MSHRYAQTNLQLYNQMRDQEYAGSDLVRMKTAYDLSVQIFGGLYRANGKPFVNHLVGTASILVDRALPTSVAIAGLMHASYTHGSFNFLPLNFLSWKKRKIAKFLGPEVESLIRAYTHFRLNVATVESLCQRGSTLDERERFACIIRLANDLEDHLDNGIAYCGKSKALYSQGDTLAQVQTLADTLGHRQLVLEIREIVTADQKAVGPSLMVSQRAGSFYAPSSSIRRLGSLSRSLLVRSDAQ